MHHFCNETPIGTKLCREIGTETSKLVAIELVWYGVILQPILMRV